MPRSPCDFGTPRDWNHEPFLYLTTTGRVTGKPRTIEVWFVFDEGKFYVFSERFHESQWVKNIQQEPRVLIRVKEIETPARARALDLELDEAMWNRVQALSRQKYGWGDGWPVELVPSQDE